MRDISKGFEVVQALKAAAAEAAKTAAAAEATASAETKSTVAAPSPGPPLPTSVTVKTDHSIVRKKPDLKVSRRAVVMKGARLAVFEIADGPGCSGGWFRVMAEGWICANDVTVSTLPPDGRDYPIVAAGEFTPWPYGFVREDTLEYRLRDGEREELREVLKGFGFGIEGTVKLSGISYFRTAEGTLIPRKDAGMTSNLSELAGLEVTDDIHWPVGFVVGRNAYAYAEPARLKKNRLGSVDRYKPFEILETVGKGRNTFYRFDQGTWLFAADVRIARTAPLPKGISPGEKWIDVDTFAQIITAYIGEKPVYVTPVSTGRFGSPTVKGEYRIWAKIAAIAMDNTDEELEETEVAATESTPPPPVETDTAPLPEDTGAHLYSLHDVPWSQFFFESYALHGVYWHNAFGNRRSHGCVNLSLRDAAWFYRFTEPQMPKGFWAIHTTAAHPGTLVRVR